VTLGAVRSHFPLVNVGVTILASFSDVSENWLGVALRAWHFFMHSSEWVLGLVMIEFRNCADGPPSCGRVAILTGYGERAMNLPILNVIAPSPGTSPSVGGEAAGLRMIFPD
jgi:hypothetical protein